MIKNNIKIILLFVSVLFIFFIKPIYYGLSLSPVESLYYIDNVYKGLYSEMSSVPFNELLFDLVFQMYPWQHYANESIQNGAIPLWNPYSLAGSPFLANSQSSIFEITKIISYILKISAKDFMLFSSFISLFMAGIFAYAFARSSNISKLGSVISGITFMLSGPIVVWMGYPLVSVIIWLPLLLFCVNKIVIQAKYIWSIILAIAIGFQFFGGNPEISWFILVITLLYSLFQLTKLKLYRNNFKIILQKFCILFLSLIIGIAVASVQIFPTIEFLKQSEAFAVGRGGLASSSFSMAVINEWNGWHDISSIKRAFDNLIILLYPDFFGNPVTENFWGSGNYSENALYVGIIPLIFALYAVLDVLRKKKRDKGREDVIFWLTTALFSFGIFSSLPFFRAISHLPIFNLAASGRLRFIFVFALAILAGYGVDYFLNKKSNHKKKLISLNVIYFILAAFISIFVLMRKYFSMPNLSKNNFIQENIFLLAIFILFNVIIYKLLVSKQHSRGYNLAKVLLIFLIAAELIFCGQKYHPAIDRKFVYPKTRAIEFLQNNIGNHRFTSYKENLDSSRSSLLPNESIIWKLQDVRGYEVIKIKRYEAFEKYFGGLDSRYTYKYFNDKIFDILGVKYFLQGKNDPENSRLEKMDNISLVYEDNLTKIYENENVMPRAFTVFNYIQTYDYKNAADAFMEESFNPRATASIEADKNKLLLYNDIRNISAIYEAAKIVYYKPSEVKIEINNKTDGFLILTDAYYEGWHAYLDGNETVIYPTDVAFRGIFVPKGKHEVIFRYNPETFNFAAKISLAALIFCVLSIFIYLARNKIYKIITWKKKREYTCL